MITIWGLFLGVPLLAFGGVALYSPGRAARFVQWFAASAACAWALTTVAWLWTAYECSTIGIDVFDAVLLKEKTGGVFVWALALVLIYLTVQWMPKNLPMRALTGILMLIPAELFKTTRLLVPASGFAAVHIFVLTAYLGAIVGMYGMFYPWRLEAALDKILHNAMGARILGGMCAALGLALLIAGVGL
jgi:hypothetical protein